MFVIFLGRGCRFLCRHQRCILQGSTIRATIFRRGALAVHIGGDQRLVAVADHDLVHGLAAVRPTVKAQAAVRLRRRFDDALRIDVGLHLERRLVAAAGIGDLLPCRDAGKGVGDRLGLDVNALAVFQAVGVSGGQAHF